VPRHSFVVDECIVYMTWPVEHVIWWLITFPWPPWVELLVAAWVFSMFVAIPWVSVVVSLVGAIFISRGYLTMRTIVIIVAGFSPLTTIPVSSVVFRWPHPFVVTSVFAVRKPVFYIH
jgi:hypothetical protein